MKLYFLRHGKAEEHSRSGRDADRCLTEEGIAEAKAEATGLAAFELQFDLILSSPYPRALETAEIVTRAVQKPDFSVTVTDELAAGSFGLGELQALIEKYAKGAHIERVLLVGHEPDFSTSVRHLTGANIELKKGGLAFVEVYRIEPNGGVLRWLLTPRHLMYAAPSDDYLPE